MKESFFKFNMVVFLLTLIIYLITLSTVSYVGVYLTYVAVPVIVISGLFAYMSRPKELSEKLKSGKF